MWLQVKLSVEVWRKGDKRRRTQVVEVMLDEAFRIDQLPKVGAAIQRGAYQALEAATLKLARDLAGMKKVEEGNEVLDNKMQGDGSP
jgi:hypothetical protein